jgi:hypothetical protein
MKKAKRKYSKNTAGKGTPWKCPECGKTFLNKQGLGGHLRYQHPDRGAEPLPPPVEPPVEMPEPEPEVAAASVPPSGAREHLKAAWEVLKKRQAEVDAELGRFESLRAEKDSIQKELEAVGGALQVFDR